SGIVQLKQPRPFSKIEMVRRNQAGQHIAEWRTWNVRRMNSHWIPLQNFLKLRSRAFQPLSDAFKFLGILA
ncbi:hypothetical protein, partial [Burkholderia cepacia]|uniref:hypothetical protein n=1 Tax=Burkholderia cepacia TaxID=292 RepID=UPI001C8A4FE4